ncbi:hypothetical protein BP422_08795 [Brevibacillus formosus]|uniref:Uncharacterized protein n=1 Tax=Brevibacillus formosus TaxID=54913 RepID=A0A220MF16_9BACL|nr:hypothetical protein [Brevibacillus formosus]ASJ53647.1 hypothetical protein BP422_08795 [Brevibacillus formosus]
MSEQKEKEFKLSPKAFAITPGGEVVIDNKQLAEALKNATASNAREDALEGEVTVSVTVKI